MLQNLQNLVPKLSDTLSARLLAFIVMSVFIAALQHFSFDHVHKINYQMQVKLITENSIKIEPQRSVMHDARFGEGVYYEFDDDGEEDYEQYNDENYYYWKIKS